MSASPEQIAAEAASQNALWAAEAARHAAEEAERLREAASQSALWAAEAARHEAGGAR